MFIAYTRSRSVEGKHRPSSTKASEFPFSSPESSDWSPTSTQTVNRDSRCQRFWRGRLGAKAPCPGDWPGSLAIVQSLSEICLSLRCPAESCTIRTAELRWLKRSDARHSRGVLGLRAALTRWATCTSSLLDSTAGSARPLLARPGHWCQPDTPRGCPRGRHRSSSAILYQLPLRMACLG